MLSTLFLHGNNVRFQDFSTVIHVENSLISKEIVVFFITKLNTILFELSFPEYRALSLVFRAWYSGPGIQVNLTRESVFKRDYTLLILRNNELS